MYGNVFNELDNPSELKELINDFWEDYKTKYNDLEYVVRDSIPIIWFGDLKAYQNKSKMSKRVVTIAYNPSFGEFPDNERFLRFPAAKKLKLDDIRGRGLKDAEMDTLIESYNAYFREEPYPTFFRDNFEKVLQILPGDAKASYGYHNDTDNIAIHIDCKSALATAPAWSGLTDDEQKELTKENIEKDEDRLFKRLLAYLDPDIILLTASQDVLRKDFVKYDKEWLKTDSINGSCRIGCNYKGKLLVFGSFSHGTPFGGVENEGDEHKNRIKRIFEHYKDLL